MKNTLIILMIIGLLCSYNISFGAGGDIYKFVDGEGVEHITDMYDSDECKKYGCRLVYEAKRIDEKSPLKKSSVSSKSSSNWVEYTRMNDQAIWLYNKDVIKIGSDRVQVWEKRFCDYEEKNDNINLRRKFGLSTEGWDKLSYNMNLNEIDCKKKKQKLLQIITYDTNGGVLHVTPIEENTWEYIIPDSKLDTLRKKVCK